MLLAPSVCGLFKWRQFEPEVILLAVGWYLRFSCRTGTWRSCSPSADFRSTTSRCAGGCSVTPRKWNDGCANGSRQPTTLGGWTRRTSGLKAGGYIWSAAGENFCCTTSFSVCSLRRAKFPIIYPDLRLDYIVATHPLIPILPMTALSLLLVISPVR